MTKKNLTNLEDNNIGNRNKKYEDKIKTFEQKKKYRKIGIVHLKNSSPLVNIKHCGYVITSSPRDIENSIINELKCCYLQWVYVCMLLCPNNSVHKVELFQPIHDVTRKIMDLYSEFFSMNFDTEDDLLYIKKIFFHSNFIDFPDNVFYPKYLNIIVHYQADIQTMIDHCTKKSNCKINAMITKYFFRDNIIIARILIGKKNYDHVLHNESTIPNFQLKKKVEDGEFGSGFTLFRPLKITLSGSYTTYKSDKIFMLNSLK